MDLSLPDYLWGGPESVSAASISSADRRTGIQKYKNDALKIIKEFVDAAWNCGSSMSRAPFPKADTATRSQNHKVAVLHRRSSVKELQWTLGVIDVDGELCKSGCCTDT
jgi:hypothetical protein